MKLSRPIRLFITLSILGVGIWVHINYHLIKGLDLQGGTRIILQAESTQEVPVDHQAIQGILSIIRVRINALGISEPVVQSKGVDQIVVELAGIKDPERAIQLIGETALLQFVEAEEAPPGLLKLPPEKQAVLVGNDAEIVKMPIRDKAGTLISERLLILKNRVLTGADLKLVTAGTNQFGQPVVQFEFKKNAAQIFYELTKRQQGKPIAILLDNEVISAPIVNSPIPGGKGVIEGNFTVQEMSDLVIKLKAGSLPVPVKIISNTIVGPSLGKDSIKHSIQAGVIGFILVCVYMLVFYRFAGLAANIALLFYLFLLIGALKLLGATLTLPGIAGIILTIGMAVDANVLIFERIHEQLALEDNPRLAINDGFDKALAAIFDSNITTLMGSVVLFWLGTGSIKGFALTLSIGIIISMFTAIFITKLLLESLLNISSIPTRYIFRKTHV